MTNNTKPIIEKDCRCQNRPKGWGLHGHALNCPLFRPTVSTQNNMSSDMSTNDKQLSENWIDDIDELIQSELIYSRGGQVVGIRSTLLRDKMIEYFTPQIATSVQEERKRIAKSIEGNYQHAPTEILHCERAWCKGYNECIKDSISIITDKE